MTNEFSIRSLGPCSHPSPLLNYRDCAGQCIRFVEDDERILVDDTWGAEQSAGAGGRDLPALELAGPRRRLFFEPGRVRLGIVTCGGLCPGLNNVIRSVVMSAEFHYRAEKIYGFRYGYAGLVQPESRLELDSELVSNIHRLGGSILSSSRGPQDPRRMVDTLQALGLHILFVVGGDGTMRGALAIAEEVRARRLPLAVVGIPKTIDNDLLYKDRSFGYETACSQAMAVIDAAHAESKGAPYGIGLVKVMGRHSGFIACAAAIASGEANFVLIPEVPFKLDGPGGFLAALHRRLERRRHAVIVVAEGAGQELFPEAPRERDASGNLKLHDVGPFLAGRIRDYFRQTGLDVSLKYFNPSYLIRSVPANASDAVFCAMLGLNAVHAGMCGKTEMLLGMWHHRLVHLPIARAIAARHRVDPTGPLWLSVLGVTGQPPVFA